MGTHVRLGRGLHRLAQGLPGFFQKLSAAQARLGDNVDCTILQRPERALGACCTARLEQITTGIGCCAISFCRKVSPSIRGISMSRVMTSGSCSLILSAATKGSDATPLTSIAGSLPSTSVSVRRTSAESSTIRTLIFFSELVAGLAPPEHAGPSEA